MRSLDEAQRNPGLPMPLKKPPDSVSLHLGYATYRLERQSLIQACDNKYFFCALCVIRGQQIVLKGGISETLPAHYHEETLCILWQQSVVDNG